MKAWTSATLAGICAYDGTHTWPAGARVYRVQGPTWAKTYCPAWAVSRHQAPADTGEVEEVWSASKAAPRPLKQLTQAVAAAFDGRMLAAGKDVE